MAAYEQGWHEWTFKMDREKTMEPQLHVKNYKTTREIGNKRGRSPQARAHQVVFQ